MSRIPDEARFRLGGLLAHAVARALCATVRFEVEDPYGSLQPPPVERPVVVVAWHDQLLPLIHVLRGRGLVALVSEHADGELLARVLERYGFGTVRGSSTRGGARGLRELLRAAGGDRGLALTPDGPRGPRHRFKQGALLAAQHSGLPLLPMAGAASSAWRVGSWDRFVVPRPFSTVGIVYGRPRSVPPAAGRGERRRLAAELEEVLAELTARAARVAGRDPGSSTAHGAHDAPPPVSGRAPADGASREREQDRAPLA